MKYSCILLDHDDTTVDSTPSIHYPSHREQMKRLGREEQILSLEEFFLINFEPGLTSYFNDVLKLSKDELALCYDVWREFTTTRTPEFYPGILAMLNRYQELGGIIVVVSHSEADVIRHHYEKQEIFPGFMPQRIIGWDGVVEKHKPHPWPVLDVMREYELEQRDILVVDDLKPGILMAHRAGVDSAAVTWSHGHPVIRKGLAEMASYELNSLKEFESLLFSE